MHNGERKAEQLKGRQDESSKMVSEKMNSVRVGLGVCGVSQGQQEFGADS